nr:endo-beta-1,4-xylanase [uncultured bacterium]
MKTNLKKLSMILLAIILATGFVFISCEDVGLAVEGDGARATTITNSSTGTHDGYDYELWKDNGNVSMTLENGGNFSCQWSNIGNMLCRKGKKFGASQTYSQIGNITIKYDAQFTPGGNSYLCVYGWSKDPLVEYYIIESYGTYKPTGTSKGSVSIDGGTYELYETTRNNQPSIEGTKTFKQFWSVRTSKRTSGTISVTEHFKAWDSKGMKLGKIYEAALTVEGYQSSGNAKITSHTLTVGGSSSGTSTGSTNTSSNNTSSGGTVSSTTTSSGATKVEAENMTKGGKYTGSTSSPFNGVKLYANDDKVSFSQNFANNSHTFKVRGASSNDKEAQVQLKIGGTSYGTFKFKGTSATEQSITANHNQGGKTATVELVCVNDNDTWDVMIDWIEISASSGGTTSTPATSTPAASTPAASTPAASTPAASSGATKVEAESMTKAGKYTGSCSSPFNGVKLYANDDKVSFSQKFGNNKHAFKVRGASSNDKEAQVQLKIGGTVAGTFKFKGTSATEQTIEFQHNKSGQTVTIELVCVNDNDTWDVLVDWIEMTAK